MTPAQRIIKSKVTLLINQPWFGQLSCYINPIEDNKKTETACITERGDLFYNSKFIEQQNDSQLRGLVCHEILHLAYQHPFRVQNRDLLLFNIACDIKVNDELRDTHDLELPKGGLVVNYNSEIKLGQVVIKNIREKTTEQIYEELKKHAVKMPGGFILDLSGAKTTPKELARLYREWQQRVNAVNAQLKGNVPQGLLRELGELENPELPWTQIIRQRFRALIKTKSWKRPNKRWLPYYFPGISKKKSLKVGVAFDTSGSISRQQLTKAVSEVWGLLQAFRFIKMILMTCDADVWDEYELTEKTKEKFFKMKIGGGGGTNFAPVFRKFKEKYRNDIDCLVFFTDGYGDFPKESSPYQTYWITDSHDVNFPFGKVIHLK